MAGVNTIIIQSFDSLFKGALIGILKAIVPAMSVSTNLFATGVLQAWEAVLFISESLLSIAVILIAYSLFTGIPLHGRRFTSHTLSRLIAALVLMPFTLYFAQLLLDVNDAMTAFVLPYGQLASYSGMVTAKLGGYSIGAIAVIGLVTLLLYLVLIIRTLLVFFTSALLPLVILCDVFPFARSFSRKIAVIFFEVVFLPFFMAVGLKIGIATSFSTFSSLQVPSLVIAGTYLLPLIIPFVISPTGSRIMQFAGIPALGPVLATASFASLGMASYAAGFISTPVNSFLRRGNAGSTSVPDNTGSRRFYHSPQAGYYSAGERHSRLIAEKLTGGVAATAAFRFNAADKGKSAIRESRPGGLRMPPNSHHRIYVGAKKNGK